MGQVGGKEVETWGPGSSVRSGDGVGLGSGGTYGLGKEGTVRKKGEMPLCRAWR